MSPPVSARLFAAYLTGFATVGIALSILGPALSHLQSTVGTTEGGMGWVFFGQSVGYTLVAPLAARFLDRGNGHRLWLVAAALQIAGLVGIAAARSLVTLIAAAAVVGAASGLIDVSGNTLTVWLSRGRPGQRVNALHLSFALGAISAPLLVSVSLRTTSGLWLVPVAVGVAVVVITPTMLARAAPERPLGIADDTGGTVHSAAAIAALCVYFLTYVALETVFAGWITRYAERVGAGRISATALTVAFWAGFAAGRASAIVLARRVSPRLLVSASTVLSVLGAVVFFVWRDRPTMWWFAVVLFAVSIAPQYASMIAYAETRLGLTGRDTAVIVATSGIGGLLGPWAMGQAFDRWGPHSLPRAEVVLAVVNVVALVLVVWTLERRRPRPDAARTPR